MCEIAVVNSYNMIAKHSLFYTLHEFTTLRTFILLIYPKIRNYHPIHD